MLGPLADHAHDLSDHLGDDHDLALLRETVQRRRAAFADPAHKRHLLEQIDQRRGELQFAAISLGERIYADKPKRFTKRLENRWEAWRKRKPVDARRSEAESRRATRLIGLSQTSEALRL